MLDFLCLRHRIVVEADGPFHEAASDEARDTWLAREGFQVLRFSNAQIQNDTDTVTSRIREAVGRPPLLIEV